MRDPGNGKSLSSAEGGELRVLKLLGIARRGRYVVVGTHAVREAAGRRELAAALVARDAGANARGRVVPLLAGGGIPVAECGERETLGRAVGKSPVAVVGVTNRELAERMLTDLGVRSASVGDHIEEDRR